MTSALGMGAASYVLLLVTRAVPGDASVSWHDPRTLSPLELQWSGNHSIAGGINSDGVQVRASADGRVFGFWRPNGTPMALQTLVLTGNGAKGHFENTDVGHILPGP